MPLLPRVVWVPIALAIGCTGLIDEPPSSDSPVREADGPAVFAPAPPVLPRLTAVQYRNALSYLLGPDLPRVEVEGDTSPYLFKSIGATTTTLSERGAQQYEEAAHAVAAHVFADEARRSALVGCLPEAPGDACTREFIARFGRRAWRRPLSAVERERWVAVSSEVAEGDAWRGLRLAVAGMLSSPRFLYRVELGRPDPADPSVRVYTDYEMASRIAFSIWDAPPDDELLDAAADGTLSRATGIYAQAARMLEDERAERAVQRFFAQYLDLDRLNGLSRDPALYPGWTDTMARSMRQEVEQMVAYVVFESDTDVRVLFSTRRTFVNAELAALYGLDVEAPADSLVPAVLPYEGPRAGVLTTGAFLAMNAHQTVTSPTLRGRYLRERVLCESVPDPPPDVAIDLQEEETEARTLREKLERHRSDPACASCHSFIDPPGFLFEHFDPAGRWRDDENGWPIDATGGLDGVPLDGARDLAEALRHDERVASCIVRQLYRHATGRLETESERPALARLDQQFGNSGYRFRDLVLALVSSEAFRTAAAVEVSP